MPSFRLSFPVSAVLPSLVTAVFWCAAALGAGYWVLQSPVPSSTLGVPPMNDTQGDTSAQVFTRLYRALGAAAVALPDAPETGRLQLLGVIAGTSGQGSA